MGFFIFEREERVKLKSEQIILTTSRQKIQEAENFRYLQSEEKAFSLLKEVWQKILPLTKEKSLIQKEAISLKNEVEEKLKNISNLEKIS